MKAQFKKGFRQKKNGILYDVKVIKLCAGEKLLIREEVSTRLPREKIVNKS